MVLCVGIEMVSQEVVGDASITWVAAILGAAVWARPHPADDGAFAEADFRQAVEPSSSYRLVRPTGFRLNLTDLPCSHEILWVHASGKNPGSLPDTHHAASRNSAFRIER
jgi:hypothetical protein